MRHRKKFNHLGRTSSHRKAMLSNMANSLILHKRITTTTAKAKALRVYVEPIITKSKDDSTNSRRVVFSYLKNKFAVSELFRDVAVKVADRPGGYTRILKTGNRLGDNADMCIIELVDYNEKLLSTSEAKSKSGRRRRSGGKKKTEQEVVATEALVEDAVEVTDNVDTNDEAQAEVAETAEVEAKAEEVTTEEPQRKEDTKPEDTTSKKEETDKEENDEK